VNFCIPDILPACVTGLRQTVPPAFFESSLVFPSGKADLMWASHKKQCKHATRMGMHVLFLAWSEAFFGDMLAPA